MNSILKKSLPHVIALALFFAIVAIYFSPSIFDGKEIQQSDMQNVYGSSEEIRKYYEEEGQSSAWTGALFSGMPTYHIYVYGTPANCVKYLEKPVKAIDYKGASMILTALICFYILMCVMGVRRWLAIAGAIAFAFASYNFIIIAVGHITKMYVIAYMPLTVAGIILLFRKKWLWGGLTFLLGVSLSLLNSHIQITYYLALFCIFIFIGWLIAELKKKEYSLVVKTTGILVIGVALAVLPALNGLYANYEASKTTMRGASELTQPDNEKASTGLDMKYAYNGWSNGKGELLTMLIPNAYGGSSAEALGKDSQFYKTYKKLGGKVGKEVHAPTYWGPMRFTAGPMYLGAIVCFLFVLGMFVIKNPIKWWIAAGALLFILMSLGDNLAWFNEILFHYLPMYNKFRVPSMALIVPGLAFTLIGFWGLKEILSGKESNERLQKSLIASVSIVGGICLLIWLVPNLFLSFQSLSDANYQMPEELLDALIADRKAMASSDALRSLVFILLAAGLVFYFIKAKNKQTAATVLGVGILLFVTTDMWGVDKRFLNDDMFAKTTLADGYKPTAADKAILEDQSPSYRVLNLSSNTFNENHTSYFHKSIGGYNAAKLRRYQELIDHRIGDEIQSIIQTFNSANSLEDISSVFNTIPTLNMLNAKYIIYSPEQAPLINRNAMGNAWFVDELKFVDSADEELASLDIIDPQMTAVVDTKFKGKVNTAFTPDSTASIRLLEYKPDYLKYESEAQTDQLAVFSEIYYEDGWKAFVDGLPVDHFRADWVLRAMNVPAGKHTIEFRFEPDTFNAMARTASISSLIIFLMVILAIGYSVWVASRKRSA